MMAMALLLHGGLFGGVGGEAGVANESGEGASARATLAEGFSLLQRPVGLLN